MTVDLDLLAYLIFSEDTAIFGANWKEGKKKQTKTDQVGSWYVLPHKRQKPILKAVTEVLLCFTGALKKGGWRE